MGYPGFRHGPSERLLSGTLKAFQLAPQKEGILFFILHSPMFWFTSCSSSLCSPCVSGGGGKDGNAGIPAYHAHQDMAGGPGKYFSAYAFTSSCGCPCCYTLLADWSNLIVQWIYGYDAGMVLPYRLADWAGAYAILLLIGAWFTAIGIFASSMTGSQIISGIITIGLLVLIFSWG
ncbi:MAG: hypothetical protein ACLSUW_02095 [Akkermansia sp.]